MSIPERIDSPTTSDYFEIMSKAMWQAGVSWKVIDSKWAAFKEVFHNFDPGKVAAIGDADVERMMQDERIMRSKKKIDATIKNAKTILDVEREFGSFKEYLHSKKSYIELSADIRKRFKFVGELSVYYLLFRVKEPVPQFEEWLDTIEGDHPRMREMVELARETDPNAGI